MDKKGIVAQVSMTKLARNMRIVMDYVRDKREEIWVTFYNKPVAKIVPLGQQEEIFEEKDNGTDSSED